MLENHSKLGFALIHGGSLDTWVWERVMPLLTLPALPIRRSPPEVNLSKLTIADCTVFAQSQIEASNLEKVIIVAHSIGGVLAPPIATLMPDKVVHIVFVAAAVPSGGTAAISTFPLPDRIAGAIILWLMARGLPTPKKQIDKILRETLCNDMDEATTQLFLKGSKNLEPLALFFEPVSRVEMPTIPCTYIKLLQDKGTYSPLKQEELAATIGAKIVTIDTGHTVMLSRPHELANMLNQIAEEVVIGPS